MRAPRLHTLCADSRPSRPAHGASGEAAAPAAAMPRTAPSASSSHLLAAAEHYRAALDAEGDDGGTIATSTADALLGLTHIAQQQRQPERQGRALESDDLATLEARLIPSLEIAEPQGDDAAAPWEMLQLWFAWASLNLRAGEAAVGGDAMTSGWLPFLSVSIPTISAVLVDLPSTTANSDAATVGSNGSIAALFDSVLAGVGDTTRFRKVSRHVEALCRACAVGRALRAGDARPSGGRRLFAPRGAPGDALVLWAERRMTNRAAPLEARASFRTLHDVAFELVATSAQILDAALTQLARQPTGDGASPSLDAQQPLALSAALLSHDNEHAAKMPTAFLRRVVAWSPATRHGQVRELRRLIGMLSESRAAVSSGGPDAAAHAHAPSLRDAMVALEREPTSIPAANRLCRLLHEPRAKSTALHRMLRSTNAPEAATMLMLAARVHVASRKHRAAVEALLSAWCVTPGGEPAETIARAPHASADSEPIDATAGAARASPTSSSPVPPLCIGSLLLGAAMHRNVNDRHVAVVRAMSFISAYAKLRLRRTPTDDAEGAAHALSGARTRPEVRQEVEYNTGRAFHHLGMLHHAAMCYRRALEMHEEMPVAASVTREAAHNLVLIYQQTGAIPLARRVVARFLTIG